MARILLQGPDPKVRIRVRKMPDTVFVQTAGKLVFGVAPENFAAPYMGCGPCETAAIAVAGEYIASQAQIRPNTTTAAVAAEVEGRVACHHLGSSAVAQVAMVAA